MSVVTIKWLDFIESIDEIDQEDCDITNEDNISQDIIMDLIDISMDYEEIAFVGEEDEHGIFQLKYAFDIYDDNREIPYSEMQQAVMNTECEVEYVSLKHYID